MELKTLNDLRIEEELCEKLDLEVYVPVKKELEGIGTTYSLGSRKEDFKDLIEKKFNDLRQEVIKCIKKETNLAVKSKENREFLMGRISFAKEFFNITEGDLK